MYYLRDSQKRLWNKNSRKRPEESTSFRKIILSASAPYNARLLKIKLSGEKSRGKLQDRIRSVANTAEVEWRVLAARNEFKERDAPFGRVQVENLHVTFSSYRRVFFGLGREKREN